LAAAIVAQDSLAHGDILQFVASDIKLLEAAKAEGLNVWDPSTA
jgi:hypothetical protein